MASEGEGLPPILPPPLAVPEDSSGEQGAQLGFEARRLHPASLVIAAVRAIRGFALPAIILLVSGQGATLGIFLLGFLGLNLVFAAVRYATFTYRIEGGDLITRQGLISRQERHIPLTRVQDLRVEAGPIHRLLKVVDLYVETAGGTGVEAQLSVLSGAEADQLRAELFASGAARRAGEEAAGPAGEVLERMALRDLVVEGLTSNRAASLLVLLGAGVGFLFDLVPQSAQSQFFEGLGARAEQWFTSEGGTPWAMIAAIAVGTVLLSTVFSVLGAIVLFYGFELERRGEDLYRCYGLLTRRASSLPRRRIQLLQVLEPWLRRAFGLVSLRADSAGQRSGEGQARGGRDVLVPLLRRSRLPDLLPVFLPEAKEEPGPEAWRRVSRCAIKRATTRGFLLLLVILLAVMAGPLGSSGPMAQMQALWGLCLLPLIYWVSVRTYRHLGYLDEGALFRTRRGWLNRTTHLVPIRNLQVVVLRQTPLDRRHDVWTMKLDTAGQAYTGGGPQLGNLPAPEAWEVAASIARRASLQRYRT